MSNKAAPKAAKTKVVKEVKSKTSTTEKQPTTVFEIVPGKFNENDWNGMLENDDSQEFIWDIIDEVIENTDKIIYKNYMQNQIIPYALNETRNTILKILDWEFLAPDCDIDDEAFIECDDEPEPVVIDGWALGYIETFLEEVEIPEMSQDDDKPMSAEANKFLADLNTLIDSERLETTTKKTEMSIEDESKNSIKLTSSKSKLRSDTKTKYDCDTKQSTNEKADVDSEVYEIERSSSILNNKVKLIQEIMRERQRATENENKKIQEAIAKAPYACQSILKSLLSRPPGYRELEIDSEGKVVSIMKIDVAKLPNNSVKPKFNVVENAKTEPSEKNRIVKKQSPSTTTSMLRDCEFKSESVLSNSNKDYKDLSYYIEPASGVTFQMGKVSRVGPKKASNLVKQQMLFQKTEGLLRPIRTMQSDDPASLNREVIERILDRQAVTENIPPLPKFNPIPPINVISSPQPKVN